MNKLSKWGLLLLCIALLSTGMLATTWNAGKGRCWSPDNLAGESGEVFSEIPLYDAGGSLSGLVITCIPNENVCCWELSSDRQTILTGGGSGKSRTQSDSGAVVYRFKVVP